MEGKFRRFYPQTLSSVFIILLLAISGCAGTAGRPGMQVEPGETAVPPPPESEAEKQTEPEVKAFEQPYDLESEMPQDDSIDERDTKIERIESVKPDSFSVEETQEPAAGSSAEYDIGYRIQLAAFADSAGARDLKKIVMAATGMAVYIDYEDGLYKVRTGDFSTRAEASEARAKLSTDYPDCWIVRTTVLKTR